MSGKGCVSGKSCGFDDIPVVQLKYYKMRLLQHFYTNYFKTALNKCYSIYLVKRNHSTYTKNSSSDARDTLSYCGITLASSVYKLYCSVLNTRLSTWAEVNQLPWWTEWFEKGWSCIDHLSTLTSIIETQKQMRKITYTAFVDFSKAYDRVDRRLLWSKLGSAAGLGGKIMHALKQIYNKVECCVKVNSVKVTGLLWIMVFNKDVLFSLSYLTSS